MFVVFYSTSDVFKAEEKLKCNHVECKIVPTPATDRSYCGVCIYTSNDKSVEILKGMEFETIKEKIDGIC
jgi:hypothetical protein